MSLHPLGQIGKGIGARLIPDGNCRPFPEGKLRRCPTAAAGTENGDVLVLEFHRGCGAD